MTHGSFTCVCLAQYRRPAGLVDDDDGVPSEFSLAESSDKGLFFTPMDDSDIESWGDTLRNQFDGIGAISFEDEIDENDVETGRKVFVLTVPKGNLRKFAKEEMDHFKDVLSKTTVEEFCGAEHGDFYSMAKMVSLDGWQDTVVDLAHGCSYPNPWFSWVGDNLKRNQIDELKFRVVAIYGVDHD